LFKQSVPGKRELGKILSGFIYGGPLTEKKIAKGNRKVGGFPECWQRGIRGGIMVLEKKSPKSGRGKATYSGRDNRKKEGSLRGNSRKKRYRLKGGCKES